MLAYHTCMFTIADTSAAMANKTTGLPFQSLGFSLRRDRKKKKKLRLGIRPQFSFNLQSMPAYKFGASEVTGLYLKYTVLPRSPETFLYYFKVS